MTDSYKEQRPLLCDDYSDEEFDIKNYNCQRRNRALARSGRARNYAKGAVAVITRWPDTCSTSVAYWWLGVSMIAIIIFVIYNSVLIFGMIPTSDTKEPKYRIFNNEIKSKAQVLLPDVYMHLFVNNRTDVVLNKYLPYVTTLSRKYPNFKYKFCVVLNDTLNEYHDYEDRERNEIAFNSLWANEKLNKKISYKYNISIEYLSLTGYLNDSPLKKFWRQLPQHLIKFLVRSVSIWEKGGIAFDPNVLIPKLYNTHYIEKISGILNIYDNSDIKSSTEKKIDADVFASLHTRRPNNIQDIINDLDKANNNISNFDLSEAENNDIVVLSNNKSVLKFKRESKYDSKMTHNMNSSIKENNVNNSDMNLNNKNHIISNSTNSTNVIENILPLFLKYIFDHKPKKVANMPDSVHRDMVRNNTSLLDSLIPSNQSLPVENILKPSMNPDVFNDTVSKDSNIQMPVNNTNYSLLKINKYDNIPKLSLDIKGDIIASKTACHAFLGTMFSNVIQHTEAETVTDFIISELSLFCNGVLTSCPGVDVIIV